MKNLPLALLGLLIVVAIVVFLSTSYIVSEGKQVVITQFGKPVSYETEPGLKFKLPFVQSVYELEKKLLPWDGEPENMQTGDKKRIFVDCWARWRISDLETFYTNVRTEQKGQKFLDDTVDSAVRDVIARHNLIDLVRTTNDPLIYETDELERSEGERDIVKTGREKIEKEILRVASQNLKERYGMMLVDVHIKRVKYSDGVRDFVFQRMRSEREKIARLFESEAEREGNRIMGKTRKELDQIEGEMKQKADEIRGAADAEVIRMTAEAYGKSPEFFEFLQRLELYKKSLKGDTNLILSTDSDMFSMFKSTTPRLPAVQPPIVEADETEDSQ
jgi:membrane protease subunit HflC